MDSLDLARHGGAAVDAGRRGVAMSGRVDAVSFATALVPARDELGARKRIRRTARYRSIERNQVRIDHSRSK
jgi:hypothetical protein